MRAPALVVIALTGCNATPPPSVDSHIHVQQITVATQSLAPEVMLALDVSAEMSPQLGTLQSVLGPFIQAHAATAVWGLTTFPSSTKATCADAAFDFPAPIPATDNLPSQLEAQATQVATAINDLQAVGARDVAAAVKGATFNDPDREHFVLLITSGDDACGASLVDTVKALRTSNVRTIVVSFGPSATPLDAAATAGGFAAVCPQQTDAECGTNNTCDTTTDVCTHASYAAVDGPGLAQTLTQLTTPIAGLVPCDFHLDVVPSKLARLSVLVNSVVTVPGPDTWVWNIDTVHFQGALCGEMEQATEFTPVNLEFQIDDRP